MTSAASITAAELFAERGTSAANYYVQIFNDNAGSPGATAIVTSQFGTGAVSNTAYLPRNFAFGTPVVLDAGIYWLGGFSSTDYSIWGATIANNLVNTGSVGTANPVLVYTDNSLVTLPNEALLFSLTGTAGASVPEPTSVILIGTGLLGLGAARKRRA